MLAAAFVLIAALLRNAPLLSIVAFGLAGLGCSALQPLTISFGQEKLVAQSAGVASGVLAFYTVGYGVAAFGVGPLHDSGVALPVLYTVSSAVEVVMGVLSFAVAHRRPSPVSLLPRPAPYRAVTSS